jgi:hypothetical protein
MLKKLFLLVIVFVLPQMTWAQDETTIVPDLTGLNVPSAAALLNRNALVLGAQENVAWTADSGLPENSVSVQSVAAGESVARGTAIDITVLRSNNMTLIYDDNDITLVNRSGGVLTLGGVVFSTVEGTTAASFNAGRWGGSLDADGCGQLWSVGRTGAKDIEGCASINWMTTNNTAEHFWTALNGVTTFAVLQNSVVRTQCPAAQAGAEPISCEFFLDAATVGETTPYVYFAYTTDRFVVMNNSTDKWMPMTDVVVANTAGFSGTFTNDAAFTIPPEYGTTSLLAPGQCILIVGAGADAEPPQPCDVIATYIYASATTYFWQVDFTIDGVTDDQLHTCSAAVEGRLTLCIMPR